MPIDTDGWMDSYPSIGIYWYPGMFSAENLTGGKFQPLVMMENHHPSVTFWNK
jgi:hypothetical protein